MKNHEYHKNVSEVLDIENELIVPENESLRHHPAIVSKDNKDQLQLFAEKEEAEKETPVEIISRQDSIDHAKKDYEEVRATLHRLSMMGVESLEGILQVAQESEHPRAYEVVAATIKNVADVTDKLMQLQHQIQDLEDKKNKPLRDKSKKKDSGDDEQETKQVTNNNAIFLGSTAELQKFIESQQK